MLDPRLVRTQPDYIAEQQARRNIVFDVDVFNTLEKERKALQVKTQALQNKRNTHAKSIGRAKAQGQAIEPLLAEVETLSTQLKSAETQLAELQSKIDDILIALPNILDAQVPEGRDEENNIEISQSGKIVDFDFAAKDHVALGEALGYLDFDLAAKIAGSRFVTLQGPLARLQRALIQFMLNTHAEQHGYAEMYVPYLVNADSLRGTGQLPKFEEDLFALKTLNLSPLCSNQAPGLGLNP